MPVRVADLIDHSPLGGPQIRIIILCALVTFLDGIDIQAMSVVAPQISRDWGIGVSVLGPILSATFAGITLGALLFGLLGDLVGRRPVLLAAFLLVSLAALASAFSASAGQLLLLRFLTGAGIGGALPNATALTAEYVPAAKRTLLVTLMYCGVPLGSSAIAFVAPLLIHAYGWRAVFIMGGILPLVVCLVLFMGLPESVRFLLRKGADPAKAAAILERILPGFAWNRTDSFYVETSPANNSVRQLFEGSRSYVTLSLWAIFFCSFFGFYLLTSWLPVIFTRAQWPADTALRTVTAFQFGTVLGGIACGWLADRIGAYRVLAISYLLASMLVAAVGLVANAILPTMLLVIAAGILLGGPQVAIVAVSANAYPTPARSTGVGWALGAGRVGAIISPIVAGMALAAKWNIFSIFLLAAIPAVACAVVAMGLMMRTRRPALAVS